MVHMFLAASMAENEIFTSKSYAAEQSSLIQSRRFRPDSQPDLVQDATPPSVQAWLAARSCPGCKPTVGSALGCSTKTDQDEKAIAGAAQLGQNLTYGCLELTSLCHHVPDLYGGATTLAQIRDWCPETCGVPCKAECPPVYQCGWGDLTTVAQTAQGCDVVTCTPLTNQEKKECPWLVGTSGTDFLFECADGTSCGDNTEDKDCCNDKGGRVKCPQNYPYMCNEPCPLCDPEGVSFSCQTTTCNANGGHRTCHSGEGRKGGKRWKPWKALKALKAWWKAKEERARNRARNKFAIRAKGGNHGNHGKGGWSLKFQDAV